MWAQSISFLFCKQGKLTTTHRCRGGQMQWCVWHLARYPTATGESHHIASSTCMRQVLPGTTLLHKHPKCRANTRSMSCQPLGRWRTLALLLARKSGNLSCTHGPAWPWGAVISLEQINHHLFLFKVSLPFTSSEVYIKCCIHTCPGPAHCSPSSFSFTVSR